MLGLHKLKFTQPEKENKARKSKQVKFAQQYSMANARTRNARTRSPTLLNTIIQYIYIFHCKIS